MSVHVSGWVIRRSPVRKPSAFVVLLMLADVANEDGTNAYLGIAEIAKRSRLSERTVHSALRLLEREGHVSRAGVSPYKTTNWTVNMAGKKLHPANLAGEAASPKPSRGAVQDRKRNSTSNGSKDGLGATGDRTADLRAALRDMDGRSFEIYLSDVVAEVCEDGTMRIVVPNGRARDSESGRELLEDAAYSLPDPPIDIRIEAPAGGGGRRTVSTHSRDPSAGENL